MTRNTGSVAGRARRKKVLKRAKGNYGARGKLYHQAKSTTDKGLKYSFTGRKLKKRVYRSLWVIRLSAAAKSNGLNYSRLIRGLSLAGIELDRKQLSEVAIHQPEVFSKLAGMAKAKLAK
ncbi:MAG: 50S ribosomal protein L20 [Planctomycetota bacterium]